MGIKAFLQKKWEAHKTISPIYPHKMTLRIYHIIGEGKRMFKMKLRTKLIWLQLPLYVILMSKKVLTDLVKNTKTIVLNSIYKKVREWMEAKKT